ncbi:hypothetical protein C8J56DRAFT_1033156 [Mycena floridula]|nr:hypothetical protein C8J56DRAFT_1033156 [Mycena floridula]
MFFTSNSLADLFPLFRTMHFKFPTIDSDAFPAVFSAATLPLQFYGSRDYSKKYPFDAAQGAHRPNTRRIPMWYRGGELVRCGLPVFIFSVVALGGTGRLLVIFSFGPAIRRRSKFSRMIIERQKD